METKPYAKHSTNEKDFKFQVHLVNPTENRYTRVVMETGAHIFIEDELVNTNTVTKEFGELAPHSSLLVDESDLGERDFTIWYNFDLYMKEGEEPLRIPYKLVPFKHY